MDIIHQLAEDVGAGTALKLMAIFKNDVDKRAQSVRDFLANPVDVQDLRLQAHSLKGLCRTYGAAKSGDAAMELQDACDAGDAADIQAKAKTLISILPDEVEATIAAVRILAGE
jgi:HPt (histidine-containing phosphotransfer) domain-containing protein